MRQGFLFLAHKNCLKDVGKAIKKYHNCVSVSCGSETFIVKI